MCVVTFKTMVWNKSYGERREKIIKKESMKERKKINEEFKQRKDFAKLCQKLMCLALA